MHHLRLMMLMVLVGCGTFGLSSDKPEVDSGGSSADLDGDPGGASETGLSGVDRQEGTEPGDCRDGADNDADGLFDCDDPGCAGSPDCDDGGGDSGGGASGSGSSGGSGSGGGTSGSGSSGGSGSGGGTSGSGSSGGGGSGGGTSGSGSSGGGGSGGGTSGSGSSGGGTGGGGGGTICLTTCSWDGDGVCDDGGTASSFSVCDFGTDCSDCGPRDPCTDTCTPWYTSSYAGDGDCDDGETGAVSSMCDVGTDCTDCGPRGL
ncbi:MAG: hypothetical protein VX265_14615 [Myxococcota bacterium]|nr:hypothetical protein [Myxococcota bacterium]